MDALTLFGALSVSAMLAFYALEARSAVFVLAFAAACLTSSAYGFLQGAWPFGVVELIWSGIALRRWHLRRRRTSEVERIREPNAAAPGRGREDGLEDDYEDPAKSQVCCQRQRLVRALGRQSSSYSATMR